MSSPTATAHLIERLYRERDAERALADDLAAAYEEVVTRRGFDPEAEKLLARYREARAR